jgi:drug/metabolite transporter (DMT)-like permease
LIVSWLWGQENPSRQTVYKILVIVLGVLLASAGEIRFSTLGFLFSLGGLVFESLRVVMVKSLISGGSSAAAGGCGGAAENMDPLVSLYYYAPVCALTNLLVAFAVERHEFRWSAVSQVGFGVLSLNALVAFFLNVASVMLVSIAKSAPGLTVE